MAVSALELRPRGAVAILDAALRVCVRASGVWALTLPGGALVTAALLHLTDAVSRRHSLTLPALGFTLAWLARGLFQGAACHHVQELLLGQGTGEPTAWASMRAALARAPSLLSAVAYLFVFNLLTMSVTLGLGFFLLTAHLVGYAVTLQGKGNPLGLYGTCARMLGPARSSATGVRLLMLVQLLVFFNLHIGANTLLYVGRKLLGIDLTFAERFASLDNTAWLVFLVAVTFTLFEPLRAATSTLLLVDGRVRQEGLDLLAAVQQLPSRPTAASGGARNAALVLLAVLGTCLLGTPARAQPSEAPASRAARTDARAAQAQARDILSRPEFQVPGPEAPEDPSQETPKVEEPPGAWQRFLTWVAEALEKLFKRDADAPVRSTAPVTSGLGAAHVLVVALIAGVLVVLALLLLRALGEKLKDGEGPRLEVSTQDATTLAADPMNALSRPPEGWAHLADELAARGEYREAVRGLYLALLSRLHRDGVIHYDTTLSNWDYLRQFRSRREWLPSFRELTLRFDFAWYGNLPVGADGYRDFRALCSPILSTPSTAEAASA
ncbi:DUF4129 domain-containing protein [Archangium sp.]|uniref:DUF4129 domain-containing protein n=1 Tax=Archangium sp. TaxID=1872627 RepID=UPI00389B1FA0